MPNQLTTVIDFIRYAASRFEQAGVCIAHNADNAMDEATQLVLSALHLQPDLKPIYGHGTLTMVERSKLLDLIERRVVDRVPVAYLVGQAWFAGLCFQSDERALVPRSPIAELIQVGFSPWVPDMGEVETVLDVCTGGGCIAIATAIHWPHLAVDGLDLSKDALTLAESNVTRFHVQDRVTLHHSNLFDNIDKQYDLIVSNPPYVTQAEFDALQKEYSHEPAMGLVAGDDGLDIVLRMLAEAPDYLTEEGIMIVEVGESEHALEALIPEVSWQWIDFEVGQMGVFVIDRRSLLKHHERFAELAKERAASA